MFVPSWRVPHRRPLRAENRHRLDAAVDPSSVRFGNVSLTLVGTVVALVAVPLVVAVAARGLRPARQ